jgi:hypothetical protein
MKAAEIKFCGGLVEGVKGQFDHVQAVGGSYVSGRGYQGRARWYRWRCPPLEERAIERGWTGGLVAERAQPERDRQRRLAVAPAARPEP